MANGIISRVNRVDVSGVSVAVSSEVSTLPASSIADPIVKKVWRTAGTVSATLDVDLGQAVTGRLFALAMPADLDRNGVAIDPVLAPTDTVRWQLGTTVGGSDVYDSTAIACGIVAGYGLHCHLAPADKTARYLRLSVTATSLAAIGYFQIGRVWFGPIWQPSANFAFGWSERVRDLSRIAEASRSGIRYIDRLGAVRVVDINFEFLDEAIDLSEVRALDLITRQSGQVVFIPDPDSASLASEAILGYLAAENSPLDHASLNVFTKAYSIEQAR